MALAGLVLTAWESGGERAGAETGDPVRGGEIVVGLDYETVGWLPSSSAIANAGLNVTNAIYDPLMMKAADGTIKPYLAESMEPSDDLTVWTLTLRPEIVFHDGTPLNAEAIKTVWDKYIVGDTSNLASVVAEVISVDVVDELTVTYTLTRPNAAFPALLTSAPGWPFSPTAADEFGEDAAANPVGTGPFKFVSWQRDNELVVERNPDYWQEGLPYLDKITFRPIPEGQTRAAALQSGDLDAAQALRPEAILAMEGIDGVTHHEFLADSANGFVYNTSVAPFDDVRIRTAMVHALDMEAALEVRGSGDMTDPATQWYSPASPFHSEAAADAWPTYDFDEAQRLYDEYINDPARSDDGPVGSPVSVEFLWVSEASNRALSEFYQASWGALGMEVSLDLTDTATLVERLISGDFEVSGLRVGSSGEVDPLYKFATYFAEGPANFARFTDPTITEQIGVLSSTSDLEARKAAVEEISLVLAEQLPYVVVDASPMMIVAHDDVHNVSDWTFADGSPGTAIADGAAQWGYVWKSDD